jgi:hypothetical protein
VAEDSRFSEMVICARAGCVRLVCTHRQFHARTDAGRSRADDRWHTAGHQRSPPRKRNAATASRDCRFCFCIRSDSIGATQNILDQGLRRP